MSGSAKVLHDLLLEVNPNRDDHPSDTCVLCALNDDPEGDVKTYTDDELKAAVDKAVADATGEMATRIAELTDKNAQSETEAAVAAAVAELQEQLDEAKNQLAEAVLKAQKAEEDLTALTDFLTEETERKTASEAAEARKTERVEKVKAAAGFPEKYLEENADEWAEMTDEAFERQLAHFEALGSTYPPAGAGGGSTVRRSALTASDERQPAGTFDKSLLTDVFALRDKGIDPRQV